MDVDTWSVIVHIGSELLGVVSKNCQDNVVRFTLGMRPEGGRYEDGSAGASANNLRRHFGSCSKVIRLVIKIVNITTPSST